MYSLLILFQSNVNEVGKYGKTDDFLIKVDF